MEGERPLTSEITSLPTPGHTPGHTSFAIASQGERGLILGDSIHHPAQVQRTGWGSRVDSDRGRASEMRSVLVDRMEKDGSLGMSGHFEAPGYGRVVRLEGRRHWKVSGAS